jgi:glycerophosphoryl diester phosphodiesterase
MMTIFAHRGNIIGPDCGSENTVPAMRAALARGWGVEVDIRRTPDGRFYISHDHRSAAAGAAADEFFEVFRAHPRAPIALNIKETGYEENLIAYLDEQGVLRQTFLFDMELIEARAGDMAAMFRRLHPAVGLAARVSDRGEPIDRALGIEPASIIWLDEFDSPWCTYADVRRLKNAGRAVYAVSPELHGFPLDHARTRWSQWIAWGVDGICTDFPARVARMLVHADNGARA